MLRYSDEMTGKVPWPWYSTKVRVILYSIINPIGKRKHRLYVCKVLFAHFKFDNSGKNES